MKFLLLLVAVAYATIDGDDRVVAKYVELGTNRDGQCYTVTTGLNVRSSACGSQIGSMNTNNIVRCQGSSTAPSSCGLGSYNWQQVTGVSGSTLSGWVVDTYLRGPVACPTSPPPPPPVSSGRQGIVTAARALYANRNSGHYSQDQNKRWMGITNRVYPPNSPTYSDCSSAATWCYWTQYGSGPDFLNGQNWQAGYTGTLIQHGRVVSYTSAQPGDLCFYYNPVSHVSIYVGDGQVVSHGSDPAALLRVNSPNLNHCRSYL